MIFLYYISEYSAMSKGLIKLDFPSVTMNEEEPEPIVESVPITLGAKDLLSEDEEEKKEKSESEEGEEYSGSKFGGFTDYFRRKKIKLQNLDAERRANGGEVARRSALRRYEWLSI